jgi:predicted small metal-binding protein
MRIVECDSCGEVVSAAADDELARRLREHAEQIHPEAVPAEEAARRTVADRAYEATDS